MPPYKKKDQRPRLDLAAHIKANRDADHTPKKPLPSPAAEAARLAGRKQKQLDEIERLAVEAAAAASPGDIISPRDENGAISPLSLKAFKSMRAQGLIEMISVPSEKGPHARVL